ncbi:MULTISPECIES: RNA polymerase sigma factor [unclassified Sphingomonas]|uniref:RNA polymerase sigma factor n=1 Tax=unclassified Sphingomonas TaxID=196159 RepID=UPI0006F87B47|nr:MULTISPECIES: RNA polymerase sigma factor [unclassified Sphingomonas]KQX24276.1 RNA polymerase [Sphingomonas sp. Root1294]KQY69551.1 RNA polymerase [Sphingomonas sp. Root50]KRB87479.1 RNA polymerase [Sphingomonas sp. Root720]
MDTARRERRLWLATHIVPHEPALREWLSRLAGVGHDQIDDLVQETYATLARKEEVASVNNPRAYAFQVARSILLQQLRRARIVAFGTLTDLDQSDEASDMPSPEQHAIARDEYARVVQAIAAMPQQTREAFHLRRVEGLSQREIAARLGVSENIVEKHITRGIKLLMEEFGRGGKTRSGASSIQQEGRMPEHDHPRARAEQ